MRQELGEWLEETACRAGLGEVPAPLRTAALVLGAAAIILAVVWWGRPPATADAGGRPDPRAEEPGEAATGRSLASEAATVAVHVVGAVGAPGVYALRSGARVADAIAAAGGATPEADQAAVNLARVVSDGEQIAVPVRGQAGATQVPGAAGSGATGPGGRVDLNSADAAQLDALPGVGPSTAAKIVADREANGPFRSVEDLMRVTGIGAKRFEALKDLVVVR